MLGCDPEFCFVDNKGNTVDTDSVFRKKTFLIGTDCTSSAHAEFRPQPTSDIASFPIQFALGMVDVSQQLRTDKREWDVSLLDRGYVDFLAWPYVNDDCYGEPFGGHIHIEKTIMNPQWASKLRVVGNDGAGPIHQRHMAIMGSILDIVLVEDFEEKVFPPVAIANRRHSGYGDKRCHGLPFRSVFSDTIEYRVPSTFLKSPSLTMAYLGIAKYTMLWLRRNVYGNESADIQNWHNALLEKFNTYSYENIRQAIDLDILCFFIEKYNSLEAYSVLQCIEKSFKHAPLKMEPSLGAWAKLFTRAESMMAKIDRHGTGG